MTFRSRIRTILAALAFTAFAVSATASHAEDVKVPTTAAEHEALAKQYKEQATAYKKAADEHREMAAAYAKEHQPAKGHTTNPFDEKMQKHCTMLAKDNDKLAADSEKAADYHTMRAKELQGK